jgi:hypothetical protein
MVFLRGEAENKRVGFFLALFDVLGALFLAFLHVVVIGWLWYLVLFKKQ